MMVKFAILAVITTIGLNFHPIHVSVCEIDFDSKRSALEITQRIFIDDLETELRRETGNQTLDLSILKKGELDKLMTSYLQKHITISLDNQVREFEYLGHEMESEALFSYFQILNVNRLTSVKVRNDVLFGLYEDQINLVHVSEGDKVKSMRLHPRDKQGEIIFN